MNWRMLQQQPGRADPRAAVTWLGAAVVLGCGLWLAGHGGPLAVGPRARPAATDMEEVGWIDQRLANEQGSGVIDDSQRECRVASLHWDRATRLAQNEYYRRFGMAWTGDHEEEFGSFRRQYLKKDGSKDVAAARAAAIRALALLPAGPDRVRPLWFLCLASSSEGHWNEAIGALSPGSGGCWRKRTSPAATRDGRIWLRSRRGARARTARCPPILPRWSGIRRMLGSRLGRGGDDE
jgi:hypothetical protein